MKANKKGISLIVLIITIVVIIILAAAIILNLSNTNIIDNANEAKTRYNVDEMQWAVNIKYADIFSEKLAAPTLKEVTEGYESITGIYTDFTDFETNYKIDSNFVVTEK